VGALVILAINLCVWQFTHRLTIRTQQMVKKPHRFRAEAAP
jgi:hypothetical protein